MSAVIRFENVSKKFTLHHQRPRSFQEMLVRLFRGPDDEQVVTEHQGEEEFWALRDVSFTVEEGETLGLIGPNGAGKSTALKLVSRIIEPTSGNIEVNGRIGALLELGAGFHPELSGRENIYLNGSILGLSRAEIDQKIDEIIAFAELERFIDAPLKHYSSGMRVRLGFSVAVHIDPEILLLDEVLAVGDQNFQRKCMDHIYEMKEQGTTLLFVSHGVEQVSRLCHRAVWLDEGYVVENGLARDVVESYLARVNEKDRERLEKSSQPQPKEPSPPEKEESRRSGSGEIRIVDVKFLNGAGKPSEVFISGQAMTIRMTYKATQRIENPVFGVGIHRDDNVHIAGPNTSMADYHIPYVEGQGNLSFRLPHLPLMAGRYQLSASVYDETVSHKYDYWHRAFTFSVQPHSPWDTMGVARLDGQWILQDADG